MARTFLKTDGDLRAVLETMFTSREFFSEGAWEAKVKSPLEMVVSAVRGLNADVTDTFTLAQRVADMGEPLYGKEPPTGYKDTAEAWLSTANVLARVNFAHALVNGQLPGVKVDTSRFQGKDAADVARACLGEGVDLPRVWKRGERTREVDPRERDPERRVEPFRPHAREEARSAL